MSCLLKDQNVAILTCSVVTDTVASVIVVAIAIASHVAFVVSMEKNFDQSLQQLLLKRSTAANF